MLLAYYLLATPFTHFHPIESRVIPRSNYDIRYSGRRHIRGKDMHEFKVLGGPYQTRVSYYYDANGEYFQDRQEKDEVEGEELGVLSRDEMGVKLANVYNGLF
ncbi:hypothetical protein Cantr_07213 [Candida viswanathii]|uniref:Uncharacterized protein n=1 Tax=Candida viswanathii TaxID=5486 RepID=A0A367XZG8_9ASCO|nr:hypothetical protein Cantr_07213 [Candida viswanathii]